MWNTSFCYGIPTITDFAPKSLAFAGDFSIHGENLGVEEYLILDFGNATVDFRILSAYHQLIILDIFSICVDDHISFNLFANVSHQLSNVVSIELHTPALHVFPEFLPIQGGPFSITGQSLSRLLSHTCLPFSNLTCNADSVVYGSSSNDINRISAEILNSNSSFTEYVCSLSYTPDLITTFEILIATISSTMDSGVCFVETVCEIVVTVSDSAIDLTLLEPRGVRAVIQDYYTEFNSTVVIFKPTAIEPIIYLCQADVCFPVSELPHVVYLLDISSSHFVYFGEGTQISFDLQATSLSEYDVDWNDHISIHDFDLSFELIGEELLRVEISSVSVGKYPISVFSGHTVVDSDLEVEIVDALLFPTIYLSSRLLFFYESTDVVTVHFNDLQYNLFYGFNDLNLLDLETCPASIIITDLRNFRSVDVICRDFDFSNNMPEVLSQLDYFVELPILTEDHLSYEFSCVVNSICEVSEVFSDDLLSFVVRFTVSGVNHVMLSITEHRHVSELIVPIDVIPFPEFYLSRLNKSIVFYPGSILSVSIFDYVPDGFFYLADYKLEFVEIFTDDLVHIITSLPNLFPPGFSVFNLTWHYSNFPPFLIESISVFKCHIIEIVEFVSISTPRNLTLTLDYLSNQFTFLCKIDDIIFPSVILSSSELICIDAFTSVVSPVANVSILTSTFSTIDIYLATVEGLFSDECPVVETNIKLPIIPESFLIDDFTGELVAICNDFRCCQGSIEQCSITVGQNMSFSIIFDKEFHFDSFSITTRADCEESTRRDPPIKILNFQDISWDCFSISNGFELASRCVATFDSVHVSQSLDIFVAENLTIFEIEAYGFDPSKCLNPISPSSGLSSIDSYITISSVLHHGGQYFNNDIELLQRSSMSVLQIVDSIKFDTLIEASSCYSPYLNHVVYYEPFYVQYFEVHSHVISIIDSIIFVECTDPLGYPVSCQNLNFSMVNSTLNMTIYNCFTSHCLFSLSLPYTLGNNSVLFEIFINNEVFTSSWNFILVQPVKQELFGQILNSYPCDPNTFDELTCTAANFSFLVDYYMDTFTFTQAYSLTSLSFSSSHTIVYSSSSIIHFASLPLAQIDVSFSLDSTTFEMSLIASDCQSPKEFSYGRCFCGRGFQYSQNGGCELCPLNFFF
ncbi:hypothetical protein GEMRC1_004226 [Eukaryota sp. GEM-RC1]